MIPEEKRAAVIRGLREAFGVEEVEDIRTVASGLGSDLVFRIVVKQAPYVLRIITRVNEQTDPARQFTCMNAAAGAGLSPRVWYASIEDGVSITDFVEANPFPIKEALVRVPGTLRRLHALPRFPKTFNYVTAHKGFIWRFRTANLRPKQEIEEVFNRYEQLCAVYPRLEADMVSCHSDLKPENIVFDGQRIWLMNWQVAFVNDRYFDLAIVANFVVADEEDERTFLEHYFGQPPDEYQRARFFLMRQALHMLSATVFLLLGAAGKPAAQGPSQVGSLPSFQDFHQRIWEGEVNPADNDLRSVYGGVHWEQLLQNVRQARFNEALRIVADRHPQEGPEPLLPVN